MARSLSPDAQEESDLFDLANDLGKEEAEEAEEADERVQEFET